LGGDLGGGIFINPGLGDDCFDIGFFGSAGAGGGFNAGAGVFAGYVPGSASNVSGKTVQVTQNYGAASGSISFDRATGAYAGNTVGIGPGLPFGTALTYERTGTLTLNDLLKRIGIKRNCECKK
jgi:hypothetical protein